MCGGTLHIVSVPIGNLEDITLRALRVLRAADRIACEDTRRTGKLLGLLDIEARGRLMAVHDHNEADRSAEIVGLLEAGDDVALVSDAGTPTLADPGFRVVRAAIDAGCAVVPVPGPSALLAALAGAGLPTDRFRFVGFPPKKRGLRLRLLRSLSGAGETLVFYVAPHALEGFLAEAEVAFGAERSAVIARELTKRFETFRRGSLEALAAAPGPARGELVVLIGGAPVESAPTESALREIVEALLDEGWSPSRAAKEAARRTGASRDAAYQLVIERARR